MIFPGDSAFPSWAEGYPVVRQLEDERWLAIEELTFGRARLHLCTPQAILDSW